MRKIVVGFILIMILSAWSCQVFGADETYEFQLTIKNNSEEKDVEIYVLLPQEYIEFAINKLPYWLKDQIQYEGSLTLQKNSIEGIEVKKENVQDETYNEDGVEYVQVKLEPNLNNDYVFDILTDYEKMNIKFRIKNEDKDYIMHVDNFKIEKGICKAEYNYDEDIIKQPDTRKISVSTVILIIILIIVILVGIISYNKGGR